MKKLFYTTSAMVVLLVIFTSCKAPVSSVRLDQSFVIRAVGSPFELEATVLREGENNDDFDSRVIWYSDCGSITKREVSYRINKITPQTPGECTIGVRSEENEFISSTCDITIPEGCNAYEIPGLKDSLGAFRFASNSTWRVGNQVWSDIVEATNGEQDFDYCTVLILQDGICPTGWHVPTTEDFRILNLALGGEDVGISHNYWWSAISRSNVPTYGDAWGISGINASFWSLSSYEEATAMSYDVDNYYVYPQRVEKKENKKNVRCVR